MKRLLIFIVFVGGYLIMSLEILGFRLLAPYFGYSIYVSGSLIGLIMAALAGGYYLGGWLAEWRPESASQGSGFTWLKKLYLLAVLFLLADLFFYPIVLNYLVDWGVIWGALTATLLIFFVPMVVLAAASPIIIKILAAQEKTGYCAGLVYACGTVGSLLGVFLTTFILIPYLGSRLTFYLGFFLALVVLVAIYLFGNLGNWKRVSWIAVFLVISLSFLKKPALPSEVVLETESVYNQIRLIETEKMTLLTLNSQRYGLAQSGFVKGGTLINLSLIDLFNIGPMITPVENWLVLGMSGGASVRQHQEFFPQVKIDAVEIDSKIIEIARERFGVAESDNLKIFNTDARPFLAQSEKSYDIIEIDLFQGSPYIPFYVLTQEFFGAAYEHLAPRGLLMMNVYAPRNKEILEPTLATINSIFPAVYTIPVRDNFVVLATREQTSLAEIKDKISKAQKETSPNLTLAAGFALDFIEEAAPNKKTPVFSDDWAPVEAITYQMLKGLKF